jgi:hypothetical protein
MDFGPPFGRQPGAPMLLDELRAIPELYPTIRDCAFYVGSFNPITDFLITPLLWLGARVAPRRARLPIARFFLWSLRAFSRPPYGTMLKLEARGRRAGREESLALTVAHPDGYVLTAAATAATARQMLDGSARRPGLHLAALLVEPERLLAEMGAVDDLRLTIDD